MSVNVEELARDRFLKEIKVSAAEVEKYPDFLAPTFPAMHLDLIYF